MARPLPPERRADTDQAQALQHGCVPRSVGAPGDAPACAMPWCSGDHRPGGVPPGSRGLHRAGSGDALSSDHFDQLTADFGVAELEAGRGQRVLRVSTDEAAPSNTAARFRFRPGTSTTSTL